MHCLQSGDLHVFDRFKRQLDDKRVSTDPDVKQAVNCKQTGHRSLLRLGIKLGVTVGQLHYFRSD
jgi:hypothetical protein